MNGTTPIGSAVNPGDRVHLLTIDRIGQRDGGHRPAVVEHIADDGFARIRVDGIARPLVVDVNRLAPDPITELSVAQAQAAPAARCAPFCGNKEFHAVDPTADDGNCRSREFSTALNVTPWVAGYPVIADVGAFRDGITGASVVELTLRSTGHYDGAEVRLTADEARRIAWHLLAVADLTEER